MDLLPGARPNDRIVSDEQILGAIERFWSKKGYAPTVREVGTAVGLSSSSTVHVRLNYLKKLRKITWEPKLPRTLKLVIDE